MTKTVVTVPIKCSTVKKVQDIIPIIGFWIGSILITLIFVALGYALLQVANGNITNPSDVGCIFVLSIMFLPISFIAIYVTCPYEFKCIQEIEPE
jgi:hypothetical protein